MIYDFLVPNKTEHAHGLVLAINDFYFNILKDDILSYEENVTTFNICFKSNEKIALEYFNKFAKNLSNEVLINLYFNKDSIVGLVFERKKLDFNFSFKEQTISIRGRK